MTQDDIISNIASQMARDIDQQVLMGALGWHELELAEGRVYGVRYLTVHPNNGSKWNEMMAWMVATFGPLDDSQGVFTPKRWYANNAKFWFRESKDRDWFVLRWS